MALVKQDLQDAIRDALQRAMDEGLSLDRIAAAWADAIHAYVSAAEVTNVQSTVDVTVNLNGTTKPGTGTATQTTAVHLT